MLKLIDDHIDYEQGILFEIIGNRAFLKSNVFDETYATIIHGESDMTAKYCDVLHTKLPYYDIKDNLGKTLEIRITILELDTIFIEHGSHVVT